MATIAVRRRRSLMLRASTVDAAALGLYLSAAGLFLLQVIGLSPTWVGLILGLGGAASMVGAVPIARLTERFEAAHVLAGLFVARGVAFAAFALAHSPVSATVIVTAAGFLSRGIGPIVQAIAIEGSNQEGQVKVLAQIRALRNAGIALGGIPIGFVVAAGSIAGFRVMFAGAGLLAGGATVLALRLPRSEVRSAVNRPGRVSRAFIGLTCLYGAMMMSGMVMGLGLPLLIVGSTAVPRWTVGVVQVGNTVLVVALQVRFSRGSENPIRARRMLVAAGATSAFGCAVMMALHRSGGALAITLVGSLVAIFTVAELLASAGGSGLMLAGIPEGQRARYLAVFGLGFSGATIVGPPVVGAAVGHQPLSWALLAALFVVLSGLANFLSVGTDHSEAPRRPLPARDEGSREP